MKIAIDTQTTLGRPTGFGFYVSNLTHSLERIIGEDKIVKIEPGTEKDFSTPQRFIWDQFTFPNRATKQKVDLVHQPCFSAPLLFNGPVVVTIHDIISILFPQNIPFASRMFYSRWMPFSYSKPIEIISDSIATKNDVVRVLKIPEEKITVIHLASDDKFSKRLPRETIAAIKSKYNLPEKYLLHIGTLEPRKNLDFLISAFAQAIKDKSSDDLGLVITGKKGWYFEGLFKKVKDLGLEKKVIFTGYIDEVDKPAIYQGALMFTFPSLYEGFGLPPLEAMKSGVPVICSNTSSMPEVVGDAGLLLSPKDTGAWTRAIIELSVSSNLREKMIRLNAEQVKKFSWDRAAKETLRVYHKALDEYNKTR